MNIVSQTTKVLRTHILNGLMDESLEHMKASTEMAEAPTYRQTMEALEDEYVTLSMIENRLVTMLDIGGLPDDLHNLSQKYLAATEERLEEVQAITNGIRKDAAERGRWGELSGVLATIFGEPKAN